MKKHIARSVLLAVLMALVLVPSGDVRSAWAQGPNKLPPVVSQAVKSDHSLALGKLHATAATSSAQPYLTLRKSSTSPQVKRPAVRDPLLSNQSFTAAMPSPSKSFEGISNNDNLSRLGLLPLPPDPNGDIGFDPASGKRYYVQWDNLVFTMWDVTNTPTPILGPLAGNTLWSGFAPCGTSNDGDPIALFDPLAQRWLLSQLAIPLGIGGPSYQCIAISSSSNPTGSYFRYQFLMSNTKFNDYPKFGVWPDAYYMSTNQFDSAGNFVGVRASAFERAQMLVGNPAAQLVSFDLGSVNLNFFGQLPSDLDGVLAPPIGAPNYFVEVNKAGTISPNNDTLAIWQFHVDWINPANSTFGLAGQPDQVLSVANFSLMPCVFNAQNPGCVPQPGGAPMLDPIGDRLMYRLQYQRYWDHESLVTNHTVDLGGSPTGHAGIRWYELRKSGGPSWTINQQGTFGPDSNSRWLGSIAADAQGNIALGYSLSSVSVFPSVMYAGRLATDPPGVLPQTEVALAAGSGSQTDPSQRWGDYSMLAVDPLDHCTFWYTNEYYPVTSARGWHTRIGAFRFPSCTIPRGPFNLFLPLIFK